MEQNIVNLWNTWLEKAITDPSWHNDVSIVYTVGIAAILALHFCLKEFSDENESTYLSYLLKEQKRIDREKKKAKDKRQS